MTTHNARLRVRMRAELEALRELGRFWSVAWHQLRHSDREANSSNALEGRRG